MARLSNYTREKMAGALAKHRYEAEGTRLVAESQELFRQVYDLHHSATMQKHMAAIIKLDRDAFGKRDKLTANVGGQRIDVGVVYLASRVWQIEVASRPCIRNAGEYTGIAVDPASDLGKRILKFADDTEALKENVKVAEREALGALQQFTTGKKLAEEWPEAMPVIGDLIPEDDRALPVIQVHHLNGKFGLPPSDRLAA